VLADAVEGERLKAREWQIFVVGLGAVFGRALSGYAVEVVVENLVVSYDPLRGFRLLA